MFEATESKRKEYRVGGEIKVTASFNALFFSLLWLSAGIVSTEEQIWWGPEGKDTTTSNQCVAV